MSAQRDKSPTAYWYDVANLHLRQRDEALAELAWLRDNLPSRRALLDERESILARGDGRDLANSADAARVDYIDRLTGRQ
jgi:hypothetical protein